ncbi:hypothetical protein GW17_00043936 [Ensete ventricosum]|nr:hypothetical protein GW17_00043936 [Ensete ventricosum]
MPPHPHYVATAAPACRQPPCQGAPAPAASVAPVGGTSVGVDPIGTSLLAVGLAEDDSPLRAGYWRPPLSGTLQPVAPTGWMQPAMPAGGRLRAATSMGGSPCGLALAASNRPLTGVLEGGRRIGGEAKATAYQP